MDFKPPQNARDVAIEVGQSQKPPQNRAADRRHVIASLIRLAGEFTGQSDLSTDAADGIQPGGAALGESAPGEMFDAANESQTTADWAALVDSGQAGDLSLAQIIAADQAASRGFAAPPPPDKSDTSPAVGSSMDALQTRSWMLGAFDAQADSPGSQPAFPEVAGFIDASMSPDIASGSPRIGTPEAFPSLESFQFDVSALENADAPLDPASPPDLSDLFFRYDTTDPPNITQLADKPADEPPGQEIQWSSSGAFSANATPAGDDRAPITYLPFGQPAPESNAVNLPADKLQVEVASSFADVNQDATLALLAFKTALLKVIDTAGEQDRIDALHREASRRACL